MRFDRSGLIADRSLVGVEFCRTYAGAIDGWLRSLFEEADGHDRGIALVAIGGYGRAELSPQSDVDVMLVHDKRADVTALAEKLWYPLWDAGLKLGHSVSTVEQAVGLAKGDLETATALLDARVIAGDDELGQELQARARRQWRSEADKNLRMLASSVYLRHKRAGEVAFLLEPNLKEGRGGLRDEHALRWAEVAEAGLREVGEETLRTGYETLLATRVELHRLAGRRTDKLALELQDDVADALGIADADVMMGDISGAARSIAWVSDAVWHLITNRPGKSHRRRATELGHGMELASCTVCLTPRADLTDPLLPLRFALAGAQHRAHLDHDSVQALLVSRARLPEPWPAEARALLVDLLAEGESAVLPLESLDQMGLLVRLIPEWEPCRSRPQRNAYHRFTVDRHLIGAAVEASALTDRVKRPDLLLIGALLHDIGKGYPGDHTEVGIELVGTIARRMGFDRRDREVLRDLVRHHLLLPDVATRRDLGDPGTIAVVAEQIGDADTAVLLGALTEADSLATGSSAWGAWKAGLVRTLVTRTEHVLRGGALDELVTPEVLDDEKREMLARGELAVRHHDDELTVVCEDSVGVFRRVAAVLALHGLDVVEATIQTFDGVALQVFRVADPSWLDEVDWDVFDHQLVGAVHRRLAINARLDRRARDYARPVVLTAKPVEPSVRFDSEISDHATVVEVACRNEVGLLYRIMDALAELGLDIVSARIQTLGSDVVDSFYVRERNGGKVTDEAYLAEIEQAVLHRVS